ncbi:Arogenate dehydratase 3 [Forsythia ovata]|uniref:Arogenate dehydratase 3 n=1 Tax=Forsythia ovata TaxID=205694 RepID=A0ABD1QLQ4_9LAMI
MGLSIANFYTVPLHGSQLRVPYEGVLGAYSEAAVAASDKAYPSCEPIPYDQFEIKFQAVEIWIVDRAVLSVENSLGGSIHRNYDLFLHHRLHIVGEVQLLVHHYLIALSSVRMEHIIQNHKPPTGTIPMQKYSHQNGSQRLP